MAQDNLDMYFEEGAADKKNALTVDGIGIALGEARLFYERTLSRRFAVEGGYSHHLPSFKTHRLNMTGFDDDLPESQRGATWMLATKITWDDWMWTDQVYISFGSMWRTLQHQQESNTRLRAWVYRSGFKLFNRGTYFLEFAIGNQFIYKYSSNAQRFQFYSISMDYQARLGITF